MKIKSFNQGSLISKHNQLEYTINKDLCYFNDVDEVKKEMLSEEHNSNNYYFPLKDIKEADNYYTFEYQVEDGYSSLRSIKKESRTLKLSLLDYILKINPLQHDYTVLDPSNIYYRNIEDVKIGFRGHEWLPKEEISDLEQYKLLILGIVSKYSYSKYKTNKYTLLSKEKDTFLHTVNNAESFQQLKTIVNRELNQVETEHLLSEEHRNRTNKRVRNVSIIASTLVLTTIAVLAVLLLKNQMETELENEFVQVEQLQEVNTVYKDLYNNDIDKAVESMTNSEDFTDEDISNVYKDNKMYQDLIEFDNQQTPFVIEDLRDSENVSQIRELAFEYEDNLVLQNELAIIDEDMSYLMGASLETMYDEQMERVANVALRNDYIQIAEEVNNSINSPKLQISLLEKEVADLKTQKEDIDDDDEEKAIDKDIAELEEQIEELENTNSNNS